MAPAACASPVYFATVAAEEPDHPYACGVFAMAVNPGSADWRSHIDVELTSVRSIAGRDLITVTDAFTDTAGERVHTLHTTVVGVTAEDLDPAIKTAVQNAMMHGRGHPRSRRIRCRLRRRLRPEGEVGIAEGSTTRTPGTPYFDDKLATSYRCTTPDSPAATS